MRVPSNHESTFNEDPSQKTDLEKVADTSSQVVEVANNMDHVVNVVSNGTSINNVSQNMKDINAVAALEQAIEILADNLTNIDAVAEELATILHIDQNLATLLVLHQHMTKLLDIHGSLDNIDAVGENEDKINSVYEHIPEITTVVAHMGDVHYLAQNSEILEALYASLDALLRSERELEAIITVAENLGAILVAAEYSEQIDANLAKAEEVEAHVIALEAETETHAANAAISESNAATSAAEALVSENAAADSATEATDQRILADVAADKAHVSENAASQSATQSADSATQAEISKGTAEVAMQAASTSAAAASTSEANAASSESAALASEIAASASEASAAVSESNALSSRNAAAFSEANARESETKATTSETNALASANAASTSAANALTSAENAATSETNAATSETNASASEASALESENAASTSEANALASEVSARLSETNAATSEGSALAYANAASVSETNAATSETNALASENAANASESAAATSEVNALASENAALTSATNAATSETNALSSANVAAVSETNALTSASNASASEANALASEQEASASEANALTSEINALASENAASASEINAASSETNASTSAAKALVSENAASASETKAATSEANSAISATNALASENAAAASKTNAAASAVNALSSENAASTSASDAATSEANAQASANAASTSETNAAFSESNASSSEANALASKNAAASSASSAATSEANALTSENAAKISELNADASADVAATSEANVLASKNAAASSASAAQSSATAAATSASSAATSEANAATSKANAAVSATNAYNEAERAKLFAETAAVALVPRGDWDASSGTFPTPTMDPERADFYQISVSGTMSDGAQDDVEVRVGDQLYWHMEKDVWYKIDNTDSVFSVNGKQGTVVLDYNDVGALADHENAVSASKWETARTITLTGAVTGSTSIDGSGNVSLATTATSDPTLTLSGDASGSATFTNLGNATLDVTVANDSHSHSNSTITSVDAGKITSGTIADARLPNTITSDITGNAATASKWQTARTLSLTGDVTGSVSLDGSGNASMSTVVADDSHNHVISNVDGLQDALDSKSATSHTHDDRYYTESESDGRYLGISANAVSSSKWATARTLSLTGDVTGSASIDGSGNVSITTAVGNDNHTHDGRYYTEAESDGRFGKLASANTWTTTNTFNGDVNFRGAVDLADNDILRFGTDDDVEHFFDGTTYYTDINGGYDWYIRDGNSSNENRVWFKVDEGQIYASGNIYASNNQRVFADNYHPNADKWTTPRTLTTTLTGDVTGSASMSVDGSANKTVTISATVADDSHNHVISNVDGLQTALDGKSSTSHNHDGRYYTETESDERYLGISANASTASKWQTARTLSLTGDVTGSVSIDGSGNASMTTVVGNDSHTHDGRYYTESESNARYLGITAKAADSNKLDGLDSSQFLRSDASDSTSGNLAVSASKGLSTGRIHHSVGGGHYETTASTTTGAINVVLPVSWTNTMMKFFIDVYEYATNETFTVMVGGYNYSSSAAWHNTAATIIGPSSTQYNVRFGHNGSKCVVSIGESNTSWSYVQVSVRDFHHGYSDTNTDLWNDGWSINIGALPTNIDATISPNLNAYVADKWKTARTLSLTGDVTGSVSWDGSGNASLSTTVGNDSHTHDGRYYTEAESNARYLGISANAVSASKLATARTLTTTLTGDVTGSASMSVDGSANKTVSITTTVANDSHTHDGRYYTESESDARYLGISANAVSASKWQTARTLSLTGDVTGSVSWDGSGNASMSTVVGNDSHTHNKLVITDERAASVTPNDVLEHSVSSHFTNLDRPSGLGSWYSALTVKGWSDGYQTWQLLGGSNNTADNELYFRYGLTTSWSATNRIFMDDYHPNADKWTTARTLTTTLTGDVTGSASMSVDGSANKTVTVATTVANDSHNHTSLTGVTSIAFAAGSSDTASISRTIDGTGTYMDFNLSDDNNNDWWRWRFTPSGSTVYDAMTLKPVSNGNADLYVSGKVTADSFIAPNANFTSVCCNGQLVLSRSCVNNTVTSTSTTAVGSANSVKCAYDRGSTACACAINVKALRPSSTVAGLSRIWLTGTTLCICTTGG